MIPSSTPQTPDVIFLRDVDKCTYKVSWRSELSKSCVQTSVYSIEVLRGLSLCCVETKFQCV
jgi:hypothetical protein